MGGGTPQDTSAPAAEPPPDVLTSGREAPAWCPTPRQRTAAIGLAGVVLLTGAVLVQRRSGDPRDTAASSELVLSSSAAVVPRVRPGPPGQLHVGLQIDVVNTSGHAVVLTSAELVPGAWDVDVLDDADVRVRSERGRPLRPGWSGTVVAHRLVDCTRGAQGAPAPRALVLHSDVDGRDVHQRIAVGPEQRAYAGRLDDALSRPEAACGGAADAGPWTPPFLPLRIPLVR